MFRVFLYRALPPSHYQRATADTPYGTLNLWAHWDGKFYSRLALDGCLVPPDGISPAFFPLGLSLYALLLILVPVLFGTESNPLMGMPMYVLVAFPLLWCLGDLLRDRRALAG